MPPAKGEPDEHEPLELKDFVAEKSLIRVREAPKRA
jgi:hypothetical protein